MEEYKQLSRIGALLMKIFPLIFISPIKKKAVIKSGYHDYSHRCGMLLLEKAFSYIGKPFSENDISKTSNGKPYLSDNSLYFSISHCDGMAVCALSETPVGIDCESIRRTGTAVMKRCYSAGETQYVLTSADSDIMFSRLWTLKECYVKMTGDGIASDLKTKCFDMENGRTLFESGAVFYHYDSRFNNEHYFVSVCIKTIDEKLANTIKKADFDIDNKHILLYNVSDN